MAHPALIDLPARFAAKVQADEHGCWIWSGARNGGGYGSLGRGGRTLCAHRYAYETLIGPIPAGLHIDHLCRVRACVNPAHMEPVTSHVNMLRGIAPAALNAAKTHCKNGHAFSPDNTLWSQGKRTCRVCVAAARAIRRRRPDVKERRRIEARDRYRNHVMTDPVRHEAAKQKMRDRYASKVAA